MRQPELSIVLVSIRCINRIRRNLHNKSIDQLSIYELMVGSKRVNNSKNKVTTTDIKKNIVGLPNVLNVKSIDVNRSLAYKYTGLSKDLGAAIFISDIENSTGFRTVVMIDYLTRLSSDPVVRLLKACFLKRFYWIYYKFDIDAGVLYDVILYSFRARDIDLLLDYMKSVYDDSHFPQTRQIFKVFSKAILYNWYFVCRNYRGVGLYMTLSGKLSKQLLTRGQTVRLRLGKTSYAIVKNNVIFRYRQTHSETGAYGLTVYYFTRSII